MVSSISITLLLLSSALLNNSFGDAAQQKAKKVKPVATKNAAVAKDAAAKKSAASVKPNVETPTTSTKETKNDEKTVPTDPNVYVEEWQVKSFDWKMNEFSKWLNKAENDWKQFQTVLDEERAKWVANMGDREKTWIESAEKKWENYNQSLDIEYKSNILRKAKEWKEAQWKDWIEKSLKKYITEDFKKWMDGHQASLDELLKLNWDEWKRQKMLECGSVGWRLKEDKYWIRYTFFYSNVEESLPTKQMKELYEIWKMRTKAEKDQWNNWTEKIEKTIIFKDTPAWATWKSSKIAIFNKWLNEFTQKLITQKQWTKWVK
ncbi:tryptophan-rich antigen [Plasmodium gonderi]|uniref:Tryptophan-rich antigen n=1 Tax=Plasmodium gonderi TaxID=77519 RepID=A0A1Y1JQ37_PLAGO|nr:tryptophan-rich antigen [Plasmodium gonderi]GAW84736.1 tryptophan-rich antigen [Plasmodium gonderi]